MYYVLCKIHMINTSAKTHTAPPHCDWMPECNQCTLQIVWMGGWTLHVNAAWQFTNGSQMVSWFSAPSRCTSCKSCIQNVLLPMYASEVISRAAAPTQAAEAFVDTDQALSAPSQILTTACSSPYLWIHVRYSYSITFLQILQHLSTLFLA